VRWNRFGLLIVFQNYSGILPFGSPRPYAVTGARLGAGRVSAFTLFVGAAGD
jgi:hypothetical protein